MVRKNFIVITIVGTVTSTKKQIINTDWVKRIYRHDDDPVVRIDVDDGDKSYTLKVSHSMEVMWQKCRGMRA